MKSVHAGNWPHFYSIAYSSATCPYQQQIAVVRITKVVIIAQQLLSSHDITHCVHCVVSGVIADIAFGNCMVHELGIVKANVVYAVLFVGIFL